MKLAAREQFQGLLIHMPSNEAPIRLGRQQLSILILADDCNPEWPSLPIVGYKYALALGKIARVVVATHVRNRVNIEKKPPGR